jgi:hypothetical protein
MNSMPTSFNVLEAFFLISNPLFDFVLREEREHLLRLHEYFDWFTGDHGQICRDPAFLRDVIAEGVIYSYDMTGLPDDFRLGTINSEIGIVGMSMVRHHHELSVMLLAGEKPPHPDEEKILRDLSMGMPVKGKEEISPDPDLGVADRAIPGLPDYGQLVLLTRIDLISRSYDVRYLNVDIGRSFIVNTDDPIVLKHLDQAQADGMAENLLRYHDLFSAVAALIYLPAFFLIRQSDVIDAKFITELGIRRNDTQTRKAIRTLGRDGVFMQRTVSCLRCDIPPSESRDRLVKPSESFLASKGYWKDLQPGEIGVDESGTPVVGKTWVSAYESWSAWRPEDFLIRKSEHKIEGPDPGIIYVMRSEGHDRQLFKIGLTRRNAELRAGELSDATGVPLPLSVLAEWQVADYNRVEAEVHRRLARFRVSKRREFFRVPISAIVRTIEDVICT